MRELKGYARFLGTGTCCHQNGVSKPCPRAECSRTRAKTPIFGSFLAGITFWFFFFLMRTSNYDKCVCLCTVSLSRCLQTLSL